jgi:hypothetical protein
MLSDSVLLFAEGVQYPKMPERQGGESDQDALSSVAHMEPPDVCQLVKPIHQSLESIET